MPAGASPRNADEVNAQVGILLRQFVTTMEGVGHFQSWLLAEDLKVDPYNMTAADETLIKSAVGGLDASLDTVDMTFINRLTGLFI